MQSNLSERNAFCRFVLGTSMTAFGISRVSRNPDCTRGRLMIALGAMKMAEGIFKYCPTKAMLSSNVENAMTSTMESMVNGQNPMTSTMKSMVSGQNSMTSESISKLMEDFASAISGSSTTQKSSNNANASTNSNTNSQNSTDNKNSTSNAQNPS